MVHLNCTDTPQPCERCGAEIPPNSDHECERETRPIPPGGQSKYRPLAEAIIAAHRKGDAVRITDREHKRLAAVQHQVYRLLEHELGGYPKFRLQTARIGDGTFDRLVWILSYDDAVMAMREKR